MRAFAKLAEIQRNLHHCDMPTNLTVPQVAQLCEVSEGTVRLWIRDEKLPANLGVSRFSSLRCVVA